MKFAWSMEEPIMQTLWYILRGEQSCRQLWTLALDSILQYFYESSGRSGCRQAFWVVDNASGRIRVCFRVCFWSKFKFLVSLFSWTLWLYKERYCPSLIGSCNWLINKISLPFCPKYVSNCRTSLNSCILTFFPLFTYSYNWRLFSGVLLFSVSWDSNYVHAIDDYSLDCCYFLLLGIPTSGIRAF